MKHIRKINDFITENNADGLTIIEVFEGVISGKIKVDIKGHNRLGHHTDYKKYFKDALERIDALLERRRGTKMYDYYKDLLIEKYTPGQHLSILVSVPELYCWDCDARLTPILKSYNEVSFMEMGKFFDISNKEDHIDVNKIPVCEFDVNITDKIVSEINVPSGELVITNYFHEKKIYESPNDSINSILGRVKLTNYLANLDVGYGQMGNMHIVVWKKLDGSEVLFTGGYKYNKETGEEGEFEYDGFKRLGEISLSVWRWMCGDLTILKKHDEKLPELVEDSGIEDNYQDYILAKVKPGKWVIEHYFDLDDDREDGVYTKLYLK